MAEEIVVSAAPAKSPEVHVVEARTTPPVEQGTDGFSRLIAWAESPSGSKVVDQMLKSSALGSTIGHVREFFNVVARYGIIVLIIVMAVNLKQVGKLDTEIVGLLSLIVGYILGRQSSAEK